MEEQRGTERGSDTEIHKRKSIQIDRNRETERLRQRSADRKTGIENGSKTEGGPNALPLQQGPCPRLPSCRRFINQSRGDLPALISGVNLRSMLPQRSGGPDHCSGEDGRQGVADR